MKRLDLEEPEEYNEFNKSEKIEEPEFLPQNNKRIILGGILISIGVLLVGKRMGILPDYFFYLIFNWKVMLIFIGALMLFNRKKSRSGIVLIIIGVAFLVPNYIFVPMGLKHLFFPAILIFIGIYMIIRHKENYEGNKTKNDFRKGSRNPQDYIDETYIFGGGNIQNVSENFKGGNFSAIFGGGKIDLRHTVLSKEQKPILKVDVIFGGVEILVPTDWNVIVKSNSIFGSFGMKKNGIHRHQIDRNKEIIIIGNAIFGGGDIKRAST